VVLATSVVRHGTEGVSQVLVHWQGKGPEEATWEDTVTIRNQFPHLNLGDKVEVPEGGIVGSTANDVGPVSQPITRRVYTRRVKSTALLRWQLTERISGNCILLAEFLKKGDWGENWASSVIIN